MVGLVLVAHSADLVRGLVAMIAGTASSVPVEAAGGLGDGRLGTSAPIAEAAIRRGLAASSGGVLVFLDLGSAFMAVDIALEALDPADRERVFVTDAPLVEGAIHAAIAASAGADLATVADAARHGGRAPKRPDD